MSKKRVEKSSIGFFVWFLFALVRDQVIGCESLCFDVKRLFLWQQEDVDMLVPQSDLVEGPRPLEGNLIGIAVNIR